MSANPKITAIHNKLVSDYIAVTRAEHAAWLDNARLLWSVWKNAGGRR